MKILRYGIIGVFVLSVIIYSLSFIMDLLKSDDTIPVITSDREVLEVSCDYTTKDLLEGLTATDEKDGDLTDDIIVGSMSRFTEAGECTITYVVFDSSNQSGSFTRKVRFTDYQSPRFYASNGLVFSEKAGSSTKLLEMLSANDVLDGDLTSSISLENSTVNYSLAGNYSIDLKVTNSYGDTSKVTLPVHIIDSDYTIDIQLSQGIIYLEKGETIDPYEWVDDIVNSEGYSISGDYLSINDTVDNSQEGIYEIEYTVSYNGERGKMWLTVIVE